MSTTISAAERTMNWRDTQIAALGLQEFNTQQSAKRKARRQAKKAAQQQTQPTPVEHKEEYKQELQGVIDLLKEEMKKPRRTLPEVRAVIKKKVDIAKSRTAEDCDDLLEQVYKAKSLFLKKSGKKAIKKSSVSQQLKKITNIYKKMTGKESDCTDFAWLRDTDKVVKHVNKHFKTDDSRAGQIQAIASIIVALEGYEDEYAFYSQYSSKERTRIKKKGKKNKLNEKERKNYIPWDEFKRIISKVKNKRDKALIGLYTLLPPRRVEDISILRLWTTDEDNDKKNFNYLEIDSKNKFAQLEYNKYKTAKTYGTIEIPLPKHLRLILMDYIMDAGLRHGDFLFPSRSGLPYKNFSSIITKTFKPYTKKKVNVNMIRHSYISNYLSTARAEEEREHIALQMGHSLQTQGTYLRLTDAQIAKDEW